MGWPKGKKRSAETRAKIAAAAKQRADDPAYLEQQANAMRARWADPAFRAEQVKKRRARPGEVPADLRKTYAKLRAILGREVALQQLGLVAA